MVPSAFDEDNTVLGPPQGMTEDEVTSLSVFRGVNSDNEPVVISCWKFDKEELAEMLKTGRVWLYVYGLNMPPCAIGGLSPFPKVENGSE